jgi:hypothetical protein
MRKLTKWALIGVFTLGLYSLSEARGWAMGGKRAPEPVKREDLRSGTPGSWHYVYWYHGTRGK